MDLDNLKYNLLTSCNLEQCDRTKEYAECLRRNLENQFINVVVLVAEETDSIAKSFEDLIPHIKLINSAARPTYAEMFKIANRRGGRAIIANADIYFDDSLGALNRWDLEGAFIHLTRRECRTSQHPNYFRRHVGAADAWIFDTPINVFGQKVYLGTDYCDQVIADLAACEGYELHNPARWIKGWHLHAKRDGEALRDLRQPQREALKREYPWLGRKLVTVKFTGLDEFKKRPPSL